LHRERYGTVLHGAVGRARPDRGEARMPRIRSCVKRVATNNLTHMHTHSHSHMRARKHTHTHTQARACTDTHMPSAHASCWSCQHAHTHPPCTHAPRGHRHGHRHGRSHHRRTVRRVSAHVHSLPGFHSGWASVSYLLGREA
jgi:hypothetical protein